MRLPGTGGVASLSLARLLQDRVPIEWQEAVAVVHTADTRSAATGIPLTLEHCHITASGEVDLHRGTDGPRLSSLQLLAALLEGQASPTHLRVLAVAAEEDPERQDDARLHVDLRWCLGPEPAADIARLAMRGLGGVTPGSVAPEPEAVPGTAAALVGRPHASGGSAARRRVALRIRVARVSPPIALAMAAVLLAAAGSAVVAGAMLGAYGAASPPYTPTAHTASAGPLPTRVVSAEAP